MTQLVAADFVQGICKSAFQKNRVSALATMVFGIIYNLLFLFFRHWVIGCQDLNGPIKAVKSDSSVL